jgi:hypothetical protein
MKTEIQQTLMFPGYIFKFFAAIAGTCPGFPGVYQFRKYLRLQAGEIAAVSPD